MAPDDHIAGIEQLQQMLLESPGFTEFLLDLTTISASLFSTDSPMHCAITVERTGGPTTVASSSELAQRLDEQQYASDDGPCLTALRQQHSVLIAELVADLRWRRYAAAVSGEPVRSVLAVPIPTDGSSAAALNCYSPDVAAFGPQAVAAIEKHANSLSTILRLALRVHPAERYPDDLRAVLKSRAVVDAAVALVMMQNRCSHEAAMTTLQVASRHHNRRVQGIADELLGKAMATTVISRTANRSG
ncbi:hypothetical protein GCM10027404_17440 [Arthrobacter tumbae]|uniref:GAF domain-containing protein n=1 Tax=Arthrobacter tumbae TaxID=163874 RepID=UPI00195B7828|nr:GAF domain-containing protein [Arthrobacter tumbae]MBM7780790.1 GAF domain-containing protein [Arthrobacter tumbae]